MRPEVPVLFYENAFESLVDDLHDKLGREPTREEMEEHITWDALEARMEWMREEGPEGLNGDVA